MPGCGAGRIRSVASSLSIRRQTCRTGGTLLASTTAGGRYDVMDVGFIGLARERAGS